MGSAPVDGFDRRSAVRHFDLFNGLRAIAALSIVVYHVEIFTGGTLGGGLTARLARHLDVGVPIFFAISGFLLYRPYVARRAAGELGNLRTYALRRGARIIPAYWVALTILGIWPGLPDVGSSRTLIYYGFGQIYIGETFNEGIRPAWSLCVEVSFYCMLPLYALVLLRLSRRQASWRVDVIALVVLAVASLTVRGAFLRNPTEIHRNTYLLFISTLCWFVVGMGLAAMSVYCAGARRPGWIRGIGTRSEIAWALACAGFVAVCWLDPSPVAGEADLIQTIGYMIIAVLLLLPAVVSAHAGGGPRRLLASRPLSALGRWSYGIYLWHYPLALTFAHDFERWGSGMRLCTLAATLTATVSAAFLSWTLIESPILGWAHARTGSRSCKPAARDK